MAEYESLLGDLSKDKKKDIREAALYSLSGVESESSVNRIFEVFNSKERAIAIEPLKLSKMPSVVDRLMEEAEKSFNCIINIKSEKPEPSEKEAIEYFLDILECLKWKREPQVFEFLKKCVEHPACLNRGKIKNEYGMERVVAAEAASNLIMFETGEAYDILVPMREGSMLPFSFEAALRSRSPEYVYENYSSYLQGAKKSLEYGQILRIIDSYTEFEPQYRWSDYDSAARNHRTNRIERYKITWDRRWVNLLAEKDELDVVCRMVRQNEPEAVIYLLKSLEKNKGVNNFRLVNIVRALFQGGYEKIKDVVMDVLEYNCKKNQYYMSYYMGELSNLLKLLPSECAKELEDFSLRYNNEASAKLFEAAQYLKAKNE